MSAKHWLTVRNEAECAEMIISGTIGKSWWDDSGTSSKEFRDEISKIPNEKRINVRINSEGGSVADGLEIYNTIKARRDSVTCYVDGYAVSIASVIALAGGKTVSPKSSIWMIHEPWSVTQGNAEDHMRSAEMLDKHGDALADIYAEETGKSKTACREAMRAETWFTGIEATEWGLADEVIEDTQDCFNAFDVSNFKNVPEHVREKISAAAKAGNNTNAGVAAGTTTERNTPMPEGTTTTAAANPQADELADIRAQLETERKSRITDKINALADGRLPVAQIPNWIARALRDESVISDLAALPVNTPGGAPVGGRVEIISENPLDFIRKEKSAKARFQTMRNDWEGLYNDSIRRGMPRNDNSYQSALVTQFLLDGAVTQLQNRWAPLRAFTRDYSTDRYKPLATGQIKFVTAGSTTQTNSTNFESGDSTVGNAAVTVSQYTQAFHVTNSELNSGLRMENLVDINMAYLADKILAVAAAPITTANFTATAKVSASANFGFSDIADLWGQLKKSPVKNLLLDGEYLARLLNQPAFFQATDVDSPTGWSKFGWNGIYLNTNWTGAGAKTVGFAMNPQAIGAIAGLPLTPPAVPGATLAESTITIPGPDISVAAYSWFSLSSRTFWMSYDLMFGAAKLDGTAGVLVQSP